MSDDNLSKDDRERLARPNGVPDFIHQEALARIVELEAERDRCHELIDEVFEHPREPADPLDVKVGRLLADAEVLLKERDSLRGQLDVLHQHAMERSEYWRDPSLKE